MQTHIGEEIADVLVYTTRLADLCNIELSEAVVATVSQVPGSENSSTEMWESIVNSRTDQWSRRPLDSITEMRDNINPTNVVHVRSILFQIQASLGVVCRVFSLDGNYDVKNIQLNDKIQMAKSLATIVVLLSNLTGHLELSLSSCVTDKIIKNSRKYPKEIVKGSSAKYTTYQVNKMNGDSAGANANASPPSHMRIVAVSVSTLAVLGLVFFRCRKLI